MLARVGSAQVCNHVQGRSPLRIGVLAPGQKAGLPVRLDRTLTGDRGSDSGVPDRGSAPETLEQRLKRRRADPPASASTSAMKMSISTTSPSISPNPATTISLHDGRCQHRRPTGCPSTTICAVDSGESLALTSMFFRIAPNHRATCGPSSHPRTRQPSRSQSNGSSVTVGPCSSPSPVNLPLLDEVHQRRTGIPPTQVERRETVLLVTTLAT